MKSEIYWWPEISDIPRESGIYAWYHSPEITEYDLQSEISKVNKLREEKKINEAHESIKNFLDKFIFRYFQEDPYYSILRGPLKPRYEGCFEHKPELSKELLQRLVEDPQRLLTIREVLDSSVPEFASPIYIGMADNLNRRLIKHQSLIEKYLDAPDSEPGEETGKDTSFAMRVCLRRIPPTRLFVVTKILSSSGKRYLDVENILNRINYPILGRN